MAAWNKGFYYRRPFPLRISVRERDSQALFNFWCCLEIWFGMNRTGHPDWVKMFGASNGQIKLHAKQKFKFSFCYMATYRGEGKLYSNQWKLYLKTDLVSHPACMEGLGIGIYLYIYSALFFSLTILLVYGVSKVIYDIVLLSDSILGYSILTPRYLAGLTSWIWRL